MRLINWIFVTLVLSVPLFVWPWSRIIFEYPKILLLVIGISIAFIYHLTRSQKRLDETTNRLIGILVVLNFASFLITKNLYYTKLAIILNLAGLVTFYLAALYADPRRIFQALVAAGAIVSLVAIAQIFCPSILPEWLVFEGRITSTIGNSNYVACFLLFPIFASLGLLRERFSWLLTGILILFLATMILLRVRSAAFGLIIGGIALCFTWNKLNLSKLLWAGAGVVLLLPLLALPGIREKAKPEYWLRTSSIEYRWKYWQASWHLIKQTPIYGQGLWSYRRTVYDAQAQIALDDPEYFKGYKKPAPRRVHNDYLEILNDGGIILLTACGTFIFWALRCRSRGDPLRDTAFACFLAVMGTAIFFFPFRLPTTLFLGSLMLGLAKGGGSKS